MAVDAQEFINPKSMVTPSLAAGLVASIAGALFSSFGFGLPGTLALLSLFVGAIVFHSKEFVDMRILWRVFYYILNSMLIFAMATGTHAVLDSRNATSLPIPTAFLFGFAYADGEQMGVPTLKQERPFFFDWTKATFVPESKDKGVVKFSAEKDFGTFKDALIKAGLATPNYKVQLAIDPSKLPSEVKSVTWTLPPLYFSKGRVTVTDPGKAFGINIDAWKGFPVGAEVTLKSGEKVQVQTYVSVDQK